MLTLIADPTGRRWFPVKHYWFASRPRKRHAFTAAIYFQCQSNQDHPGFRRQQFRTSLIDISRDDSELINSFSKNTKYKIRRAEKDFSANSIVTQSSWPDAPHSGECQTMSYEQNVVTRTLVTPTGPAIRHTYVLDPHSSRVRMHTSSSGYEEVGDKQIRDDIARYNRLLHYWDMIYFRDLGYHAYDFGGISLAPPGTKLGNIDNFKLGFRGRIVDESMFISMAIVAYNKVVHRSSTRV